MIEPRWITNKRLANREYHRLNPDKVWARQLKMKYGLTVDGWNGMFNNQNGCCAICHTHQSKLAKRLQVDHCHRTQKIRGLLCASCNMALGLLKDNPLIIQHAAHYLTGNSAV